MDYALDYWAGADVVEQLEEEQDFDGAVKLGTLSDRYQFVTLVTILGIK